MEVKKPKTPFHLVSSLMCPKYCGKHSINNHILVDIFQVSLKFLYDTISIIVFNGLEPPNFLKNPDYVEKLNLKLNLNRLNT